MQIRYLLCILFSFSFLNLSIAQEEDPHYGCHHAHKQIKMTPLTAKEKAAVQASTERSDTLDILHYAISLEVHFSTNSIDGYCDVLFTPKMNGVEHIELDLLNLNVDSVATLAGTALAYNYNGLLIHVDLDKPMNVGDSTSVRVYYNGTPTLDPSGFGGFAFENGYAYNLGIGLTSSPHNFGRSWYPCFDNFVERSTYEYNMISSGNNKAYCVGTFIEDVDLGDNRRRRTYRMNQQIPTYLSAVAVSSYGEINGEHFGENGSIPTQLVAKTSDVADMDDTFASLGAAIDALEFWYGPYQWERVGYVATPVGAMEHPTNIAYPTNTATSGDNFGHRRLMAHELAHCWWGDYVTVASAKDMWFKEGNAEYGAHLMTEYRDGQEAFIDQVKDNFVDEVLSSAHVDDEGYQPLSGIPHEQTYGTHTYNKGASMLHNLRGYLGDSLFRKGQRSVLEAYKYSYANAAQYRNQLMAATDYDLVPFFDNWIYSPGYSAFEVNDMTIAPFGNVFQVTLDIQQKLHEAPAFHTDVPLEFTFTAADGTKYTERVFASGEFSQVAIDVPFEPVMTVINENHKLNMAHIGHQKVLTETGTITYPYVAIRFNVKALEESVPLHVDHYWVAPDPVDNPMIQTSSTHYWRIDGDRLSTLDLEATLEYGKFFDEELTGETEEHLKLIFRYEGDDAWGEYPFYTKIIASPSDGKGFIRLQSVLEGEYAFVNDPEGVLEVVNTENIVASEKGMTIFPNPSSTSVLTLELEQAPRQLRAQVFTSDGKLIKEATLSTIGNSLQQTFDLGTTTPGLYWIKLTTTDGYLLDAKAVEIK